VNLGQEAIFRTAKKPKSYVGFIHDEIKITNNLLEHESNELKCHVYQSIVAMKVFEFEKSAYEINSKWKLEKDLENDSNRAHDAAKAWISLHRIANQ